MKIVRAPRASWLLACAAFASCAATDHGAIACDLAAFECTDPAAWRIGDDGGPCLELFAQSKYTPPFRSPLNLALLRDATFADFDLTVQARQTSREYAHRDLVLVFDWVDAAHFAYAHLATKGDDNAHQVFVVDGRDRHPVTTRRTAGVAWGDGWHALRLARGERTVVVQFDGEEVLRAELPAQRGRIGVGSFDDTGRFRDLRVVASATSR